MIDLIYEPETWVAIAFLIFVGTVIKLGAPQRLFKALDDRSVRIKAELDEALKLRKEAEGVLAEYRRRQGEAERTAESIVLNARVEADRMAAEAQVRIEEFIARRTKMAETKIAQAEAQALADVRAAAADADQRPHRGPAAAARPRGRGGESKREGNGEGGWEGGEEDVFLS